jgi:hypothetical protein
VDVRAGNGVGSEWLHYGLISAITPLSRSIFHGCLPMVMDESSLRLL